METPSSTTSLISASTNLKNNIHMSNSEKGVSKSRPRTGALIDITNDSPIVGIAMGKLETPLSEISKKRTMNHPQSKDTCTPGSGEALLRCQVKTLLQKVEEEADISKVSLENNKYFLNFQGFLNSPIALIAPTPANTPQIGNLLGSQTFKNVCLAAVTPSPVQEQLMISQKVDGVKQEGSSESEKNLITRSLLFDFSDKSEGLDTLTVPTNERDINDYDDEGLVDQLCEGMSKINVNGAKFEGRHTRFVYNSDGEFEGGEEFGHEKNKISPSIVKLKGLPTPKGKHLRFSEDN